MRSRDHFEAFVLAVVAWTLAGGRRLAALRSRLSLHDRLPRPPWSAFRGVSIPSERGQSDPARTAKAAAGIVGSVGLVGLVEQYGVGGVLYAISLETISAIQGLGDALFAPVEAFGGGIARVVAAAFPARIINSAADFTAFSITQGEWSFFGPLTFVVGVLAVAAGIYVMVAFVRRLGYTSLGVLLNRR